MALDDNKMANNMALKTWIRISENVQNIQQNHKLHHKRHEKGESEINNWGKNPRRGENPERHLPRRLILSNPFR